MKKTIITCAAVVTLLISCGDKKKSSSDTGTNKETTSTIEDESDNKSATFKVDGTIFIGRVSTQHFGGESDNFSVLCQQDEPLVLLQAVYANEKEATANATYKPAGSFYNVSAGDVNIALSGSGVGDDRFNTSDESTGTISVEGKKLIIKDLKLFNSVKKEKVLTATIPF
ncbi:MAG: hypothetical protein ABIP79_17405 [Chitinophagaceae bacterium]